MADDTNVRIKDLENFKDSTIGKVATLDALLGAQGRDIKAMKIKIDTTSSLMLKFIGGVTVIGFLTGVILTIISMVCK